jgi:hypothetical protein
MLALTICLSGIIKSYLKPKNSPHMRPDINEKFLFEVALLDRTVSFFRLTSN